jgi:hypothetical protein
MCKKKKTPEQLLFDTFDTLTIEPYKKTVLQERYLAVLRNFHKRARTLGYMYYISRLIMTVGSILVPAFLSIQQANIQLQFYWATWILSLSVTITNGIMTLFKLDKKYFFINTTLEMLHSEGWQYIGLCGKYSGKEDHPPPTHENQFLIFFRMAEKIKMRQVEEEFWKFTDTSGVGNATNQNPPLLNQTPLVQQGALKTLPDEQQSSLQRWVGEMNPGMLGLQPRKSNILRKVDGEQISPGISESSSEASVSVRHELPRTPITKPAVVRGSSARKDSSANTGEQTSKIPKNTLITLVSDESGEWSGAEEEP